MSITRRSVLQTLAAVPAVWSLRGFPAIGQAPAASPATSCPTSPPPSPNSAFVLLEGPWLIFPNSDKKSLTAVTIDGSKDKPCFKHICSFSKWHLGQDPHSTTPVNPGQQWSVNSNSAGNYYHVFDTVFGPYPFVWANNDTGNVDASKDRSVVLTIPKAVHIAGILKDVTASAPGNYLRKSGVNPHIVTILEYDPDSLTLTPYNGNPQQIVAGDQLVFRMRHNGSLIEPDKPHVLDAFAFLKQHLGNSPATFQLSDIPDTDYTCGDSDGFSDKEMGLHHPSRDHRHPTHSGACPLSYNYSNCCGGTIIAGGDDGRSE